MVSLNFTLILQLLLFLGFMWAIDRLAFRPILALLDRRQAEIERNKQEAISLERQAEQRRAELAAELARAHHAAVLRFQHALFAAVEQNNREIAALRAEGDHEIESLRKHYKDLIRAEQDKYPHLAGEIAKQMACKLGLGQQT